MKKFAILYTPNGNGLSNFFHVVSNTLLFAESSEPVEWTRPEGLSIDAPGSLGLGSKHPGGFDAAFADGSIRFLTSKVPMETLKAIVTKAGGEVVNP